MTSSRDRQRAAARAKLEREMTLRAQSAARRRRIQAIIGAGVAVVLVIAGVVWLTASGDDTKKATTSPNASASASAAPSATGCQWIPLVDPNAPPPAGGLPKEIKDVGKPPAGEPRSGTQVMTIATSLGALKVSLDTAHAPCTAASFTHLAAKRFFDNTECHRMTTSGLYVLQCGDPSATGRGGPSYRMAEENLPTGKRPAYAEGVVAMAKSQEPSSTGSQFFIVYKDTELDPLYSVAGRVTEGLDIVKRVAEAGVVEGEGGPGDGKPKTAVKITTVTVEPPKQ